MIRYNNTAFLKFDSEINGNAFSRGPVTIQLAGLTSLAALFQDEQGLVSKDNPVQTDDNGQYFFYIADGDYDIFINKGNVGATSILDETIAQVAVIAVNERVINSESDFPAPIAGVITGEDNVVYIIGAGLSSSNRFIPGLNNVITSNNSQSPEWEYTGTGNMFTMNDTNVTFRNIRVSCPNAQVIEHTATIDGIVCLIDNMIITSCLKVATFDNLNAVSIKNWASGSPGQGITVLGSGFWRIFDISTLLFLTSSATFVGIDLGTSVHDSININDFTVDGVPGSIGISGAPNSDNLKVNSVGRVTNSNFLNGVTSISGLTLEDIRWVYTSNSPLPDSKSDALISTELNALETTIATINTPVKMNAVWSAVVLSHFTSDGTGTLTYVGERDERLPMDASVNLLMASGGSDKQVSAYMVINGSVLTETKEGGIATSTKIVSLNMIWQYTFTTGDTLDIFLENNSDTVNIIGQKGTLRIK